MLKIKLLVLVGGCFLGSASFAKAKYLVPKEVSRSKTPIYSTTPALSEDAHALVQKIPERPFYCAYQAEGSLIALTIFEPRSRTLWTRTGLPAKTREYKNVTMQVGLPPFHDFGITVVAFGDVPMVTMKLRDFDCPLFEFIARALDPRLDAEWVNAPWGPVGVPNGGTCYIGDVPAHLWKYYQNW